MNDAIEHEHYFTPLRYMLLWKVAHLFDDPLAERSWNARLNQNKTQCEEELKAICAELRARLNCTPDARSRELIDGALARAIVNPGEIENGASYQESALQISPNLVGFQQVLHGISATSASVRRPVRSIVVDRQSEFNNAQQELNGIYLAMRGQEMDMGVEMPTLDMRNMPAQDIEFRAGDASAGPEMVDVYVWTMKRKTEHRPMSGEVHKLIFGQRHCGRTDDVLLAAIDQRWAALLDLPMPEGQTLADAQSLINEVEARRTEALRGID